MDAIANWIWQGSAVALVATALLRAPRISATSRGRLWWITLAIVLLLPAGQMVLRFADAGAYADVGATGAPQPDRFSVVLLEMPWWSGPLALAIWTTWVGAHLARTMIALIGLRRAKRASRPFPEERALGLPIWTALRAGGRRTTLVVSNEIHAAAVLGLRSPAIAVSPVVARALSDDDLDRIIAHEWAHVQRYDDIARLVQVIVRGLAGLHPAVWWIDRQIHLERETACDDWAVNVTGSAKAYAACLTKLASIAAPQSDAVLLPAALASSELTRRVVRLLDGTRSTSTGRPLAPTAIVSPIILAVAIAVAGVQLVVHATPSAVAAADASVSATDASPRVESGEPMLPSLPAAEARRPPTRRERRAPASMQTNVATPPRHATGTRPDAPVQTRDPDAVLPTIAAEATGGILPGILMPLPTVVAPAPRPSAPANAIAKGGTPWSAAADAGAGVGRGSQKAAVATAGFFTRLSKSIAGGF